MATTEIVPGLFRIPLAFVNAYALVGSDSVTLVDTGPPGRHEQILAALTELGYDAESVATIVITHLHADHTGGLKALRAHRAEVCAHAVDARAIRATLRRLASLDFEVAVFGHGDPIRSGAGKAFRDRFGGSAQAASA